MAASIPVEEDRGTYTGTPRNPRVEQPTPLPQYTLRRILGTWAAAALPMAALAWLAAPWLAGQLEGPSAWPRALLTALTVGLAWQAVLVLVLVRRERGSVRWSVLKEALWLRAPQSPGTGRRGGRVWLVVVPFVLAVAATEMLPHLPSPDERDMGTFLASAAGQHFFAGNWPWFALTMLNMVLNTVVGEELLFRGLLLPRMRGVFGRRDWVANGVLFACYHLHVPWAIPRIMLDTFWLAYPSKRYRSALVGIAVHSAQTVVLGGLLLALVLR